MFRFIIFKEDTWNIIDVVFDLAVYYLWDSQCLTDCQAGVRKGEWTFHKMSDSFSLYPLFSPCCGTCYSSCGSEIVLPGYTIHFNPHKKGQVIFKNSFKLTVELGNIVMGEDSRKVVELRLPLFLQAPYHPCYKYRQQIQNCI